MKRYYVYLYITNEEDLLLWKIVSEEREMIMLLRILRGIYIYISENRCRKK